MVLQTYGYEEVFDCLIRLQELANGFAVTMKTTAKGACRDSLVAGANEEDQGLVRQLGGDGKPYRVAVASGRGP